MKNEEKTVKEFTSMSFVFYDSFKESIDCFEDKDKLMLYEAIANYGLHREQTPELKGPVKGVFITIKAQLDANFRKRENAKKGGAPVGNQNAKKKTEE